MSSPSSPHAGEIEEGMGGHAGKLRNGIGRRPWPEDTSATRFAIPLHALALSNAEGKED
jgi:hypothetical protein